MMSVYWVLCTGAHFSVYTGFLDFLGDLDETWALHSLVCIVHSGLLIQMKEVLQGISGGALWVVR